MPTGFSLVSILLFGVACSSRTELRGAREIDGSSLRGQQMSFVGTSESKHAVLAGRRVDGQAREGSERSVWEHASQ